MAAASSKCLMTTHIQSYLYLMFEPERLPNWNEEIFVVSRLGE